MLKSVDFYYFSGTGNTILVLQEIKRVFKEHDADKCTKYGTCKRLCPVNNIDIDEQPRHLSR